MKRIVLLFVFLATAGLPRSAESAEVYLIRGGFNVFSLGMNEMAEKLRSQGIRASAHGISAWRGIAADIVKRSKTKEVSYPIIYLGHSLGANAAPQFAAYLDEHGISADLVIGFDATGRRVFTGGARQVIHYGASRRNPYRPGPGFKGAIRHVGVGDMGANHFNIERKDEVQEMVLREVVKVAKSRSRSRYRR